MLKKQKTIIDQEEFRINYNPRGLPFLGNNKSFKKSEIFNSNHKDKFQVYELRNITSNSFEECIDRKIFQKTKRIKVLCEFELKDNLHYPDIDIWERTDLEIINQETIETKTLEEIFKELGSYKLIATEAEFDDYLKSDLSCDDWCRIKLAKTMLELDLGNGFINGFDDLIGNNLERYNLMIDFAKECDNRDLLMYMLVKKFGDKK